MQQLTGGLINELDLWTTLAEEDHKEGYVAGGSTIEVLEGRYMNK